MADIVLENLNQYTGGNMAMVTGANRWTGRAPTSDPLQPSISKQPAASEDAMQLHNITRIAGYCANSTEFSDHGL